MQLRSRAITIVFSVMTNNNNMSAKKALDTIDRIVVRLVEDKK